MPTPRRQPPVTNHESPATILGIDPGTRSTGWAVVALAAPEPALIASGVISPAASLPIDQRLLRIFDGLRDLIAAHEPAEMAVEEPFVGENVRSAMAVGQARTVAMLAGALAGLPVHHYPPAKVKQAVAGYGRGDKAQVREMLRLQLGVADLPGDLNATDAIAVALCHAFHAQQAALLGAATPPAPASGRRSRR
jgi:crossover junction endodeoxyribonuclease RuvC